MKRLLLAPFIALAFATAPVHAAPPSEQDLEKLMVAMGAEKITEQMIPAIMSQSRQVIEQSLPADEEKRARAQRILAAQEAELRKMLTWSRLQPIYTQVYADTLTDKEVQALTVFYESPEGRSLMQKLPQIMQRTMAEMQPMVLESIQNMVQSVEKEMSQDKK